MNCQIHEDQSLVKKVDGYWYCNECGMDHWDDSYYLCARCGDLEAVCIGKGERCSGPCRGHYCSSCWDRYGKWLLPFSSLESIPDDEEEIEELRSIQKRGWIEDISCSLDQEWYCDKCSYDHKIAMDRMFGAYLLGPAPHQRMHK